MKMMINLIEGNMFSGKGKYS